MISDGFLDGNGTSGTDGISDGDGTSGVDGVSGVDGIPGVDGLRCLRCSSSMRKRSAVNCSIVVRAGE